MTMNFRYHRDFQHSYGRLKEQEKDSIQKAIRQVMVHYQFPAEPLSYGARLKRLGISKQGIVYEIRAGIKFRVLFVYVKDQQMVLFRLIADHDEVRRFIRGFDR